VIRLLPIVLCLSCAPVPWIAQQANCTPRLHLPMKLVQCSDDTIGQARCLYEYRECDLWCEWQMDRADCGAEWDITAHRCTVTPDEGDDDG
jgi:hypothetical protein